FRFWIADFRLMVQIHCVLETLGKGAVAALREAVQGKLVWATKLKAGTMARCRKPIPARRETSRHLTPPCTLVYGCWKNVSNRATFGHFSATTAQLSGWSSQSASCFKIKRSERMSACPAAPETVWPREPQNGHISGWIMFTKWMGSESILVPEVVGQSMHG